MSAVSTTIVFAILLGTSAAIDPIWLSPRNPFINAPEDYSEQHPARGIWSDISVGTGGRMDSPIFLMDSKKTLWIMFGVKNSSSDIVYGLTVWNYDPKTDLYRWVAGPGNNNVLPINPGKLRVPSPDNFPGGINFASSTIDHNDNIWFITYKDDCALWMFNTTSYLFTRMSAGTDVPNYGVQGQPSDDVYPGPISAGCFVTDSHDNLWLVSGTLTITTNTIWHFNTTSLQWTFISGDNYTNDYPTFFTRFGSDPFYGGRNLPGCDIDSDDRIWLFGGTGYFNHDFSGFDFSDVWSYDTRTTTWQLEYGTNDSVSNAVVVVSNDFNAGNMPPGKEGATVVDRKDGTLLIGLGAGIGGTPPDYTAMNDLWLFNKSSKQWKLIYGDPGLWQFPGNFTHYRSPGSVMPGRMYHGTANGLNLNGDVFIFGGGNPSSINGFKDIWIIPADQCSNSNTYSCGSNAQCVEEMIEYSCKCNEGFNGDGVTCTAVPVVSSGRSTQLWSVELILVIIAFIFLN